jgi:hypothetical protein
MVEEMSISDKIAELEKEKADIFEKIKWALKLASPKDNALNYKKYQEDVIELIKEEFKKQIDNSLTTEGEE